MTYRTLTTWMTSLLAAASRVREELKKKPIPQNVTRSHARTLLGSDEWSPEMWDQLERASAIHMCEEEEL